MNKQSKEMAKLAYQALSEKKAEDIRIIDISEISVIADYFIIAISFDCLFMRTSCIVMICFKCHWIDIFIIFTAIEIMNGIT